MTTIVNTPRGESSDSGLGLILGVIIAIALVVLFFVYGLPALRQGGNNGDTNINVTLPEGMGGTSGGANDSGSPSGSN